MYEGVDHYLPGIPCFNTQKCIEDLVSILPLESLGVKEDLSYEESPVQILD